MKAFLQLGMRVVIALSSARCVCGSTELTAREEGMMTLFRCFRCRTEWNGGRVVNPFLEVRNG